MTRAGQSALKLFLVLCGCLLFLAMIIRNGTATQRALTYSLQVFRMIGWEEERADVIQREITAQDEWSLHAMNMRYYTQSCDPKNTDKSVAWVTALMNDKYTIPTVVLGYLLQHLSCVQNRVAMVSEQVRPLAKHALEAVGFTVRVVDGLDCNFMDREMGRSERNKGIYGTHSRLLSLNLTEFSKVIYLDSDFFPISPIDHLFDNVLPGKITATYCSKPGIIDPCFNAGLIGVVPDSAEFQSLMEFWKKTTLETGSCADDQRLLWYHFAMQNNWIPLPYSYNVRRERYFPMRSFHFAGHGLEPRPWEWAPEQRLSKEAFLNFNGPLHGVMDIVALWWRYLYQAVDEQGLWEYWGEVVQPVVG